MSSREEDQWEEPAGKIILPSNMLEKRPGKKLLSLSSANSGGALDWVTITFDSDQPFYVYSGPFCAQNDSNVLKESFFGCFGHF